MMYGDDEVAFRKAFNVRCVEKCCGTCKHFERKYEDCGCAHPRQAEFDSWEKEQSRLDPTHTPETYGAYGGINVDEGCVCDLWEEVRDDDR